MTMGSMRYAGLHWPANAGGEHPDRETIYGLPGVQQGALLICADSARFWYAEARARCPIVVWRGLPRVGKLPAQLGWNPKRVADECLNLWDEQSHGDSGEWFLPLNELQFDKENGGPFPGYQQMAQNLTGLRVELRKRIPGVSLMFPAWVPSDDGDHIGEWRDEAEQWDAICLHCYGDAETMRSRYQAYRDVFTNTPFFVGEWNANHGGADERESLQMWAEIAKAEPFPLFMGATYYIWETHNDGEQDLSIWGNVDRMVLFMNPPVAHINEQPAPEPMPDPPLPEPEPVPEHTTDPAPTAPAPVYDPNTPAIAQNDPWSCAPTSARWGMTAWGRHPSEQWFESTMLADGVVSKELGLFDATGAGLAAWLSAQYGEFGFSVRNAARVSFDDVKSVASQTSVLAGGRTWGHWSGVRGYDPATDTLQLANPADGWMGVGQAMTRQQFDALGPFSMVVVAWQDPAPPVVVEPPVPQPEPAPGFRVGPGVLAEMTRRGDEPITSEIYHKDEFGVTQYSSTIGRSGSTYQWAPSTGLVYVTHTDVTAAGRS